MVQWRVFIFGSKHGSWRRRSRTWSSKAYSWSARVTVRRHANLGKKAGVESSSVARTANRSNLGDKRETKSGKPYLNGLNGFKACGRCHPFGAHYFNGGK